MKKAIRTLVVGLFYSLPAVAADPWTKVQVAQQIGFTVLLAADWGQTKDIKNHPNIYESNPILGPYPTDSEIDRYFATAAVGHALVAHLLPSRRIARWLPNITWRDAWQHVWIACEAMAVENNYSLGVSFDF